MHAEIEMLMSSVLDGEASPPEEARLREHLATCPGCAAIWQQWRALDLWLVAVPMLAPPGDFVAGVMSRLEERRRRRSRSRWVGSGLLLVWFLNLVAFWFAVAGVVWWGLWHPLEASIVLSSGAQFLSGLSRLYRSIGTLVGGVNEVVLVLAVGLCLFVTGSLVLLWSWVMIRSRDWVRTGLPLGTYW